MTKEINVFVSENRRDIQRINTTLVPISGQGDVDLSFSNNEIIVDTEIRVYTRSLNNSLISGHPNGQKHGSGHGEAGTVRGSWSLTEDVEESERLVSEGRSIIAQGLDGQNGAYIEDIAIGSDSTSVSLSDSSLKSQNNRVGAWTQPGSSSNETIAEAVFLFNEYGDTLAEYGVYSNDDSLYNRITTNDVTPTQEEEVRIEVEFTVTTDSVGDAVVTNDCEDMVSQMLRDASTSTGLNEIAFGTGTTEPSDTDSSLDTEVYRKNVSRDVKTESVTTKAVTFRNEPASQPVDIAEVGVIDTNGNTAWRTVIESFTKDDDVEFRTNVRFRIK